MEKRPSYNLSEEELAYIGDYLNDALDANERSAFEVRLREDLLFRQKVNEVRALLIGVREANLAEQLDSFHAGLQESTREATNRKPLWRNITWLAAAAILLFAAIGFWFFWPGQPPEKQLFSQYYKGDPGLPTLMGTSDNYAFEEAMVDYKTGDFRKALEKWRPLLAESPENDTLNYFIGVAYLADNRPDSAVVFLNEVVNMPASVFRSDAYWYKALALLKQGKRTDALEVLSHTEHHAKDSLSHAITALP